MPKPSRTLPTVAPSTTTGAVTPPRPEPACPLPCMPLPCMPLPCMPLPCMPFACPTPGAVGTTAPLASRTTSPAPAAAATSIARVRSAPDQPPAARTASAAALAVGDRRRTHAGRPRRPSAREPCRRGRRPSARSRRTARPARRPRAAGDPAGRGPRLLSRHRPAPTGIRRRARSSTMSGPSSPSLRRRFFTCESIVRSYPANSYPRTRLTSSAREYTRPGFPASVVRTPHSDGVRSRVTAVERCLVAALVDAQAAAAEGAGRPTPPADAVPPQDQADAQHDLLRAERLGHVVVGSALESPDAVLHRASRGERDHGVTELRSRA